VTENDTPGPCLPLYESSHSYSVETTPIEAIDANSAGDPSLAQNPSLRGDTR
jgi:hypothetical protein